jgi:hypothetical protein
MNVKYFTFMVAMSAQVVSMQITVPVNASDVKLE